MTPVTRFLGRASVTAIGVAAVPPRVPSPVRVATRRRWRLSVWGVVALSLMILLGPADADPVWVDPRNMVPVAAEASPTGYTAGGQGYLRDRGRFEPVNVPGATGTLPFGINNRGQIVGAYDDRNGVTHGFVRDRGRFITVDHPRATGVMDGVSGTALFSINNHGQIAGAYVAGDGIRGFLLDRGRFIPIDAPGAETTIAFGINDRGQITIQAGNPDGTLPQYLLDRGRFTRIVFPGATDTLVHKINSRGQVVGVYTDNAGRQHGFVLDRGRYTRLDVPGAVLTGLNQSNTRGEYVGYYANEGEDGVHGHVLRDGTLTSIDAPGAPVTTVYDINDRSLTVGAGLPLPDGQSPTAMTAR